MNTNGLRSGQLADAAGVNVQTLRYYERRGLLHRPDRTLGGHRLYPPETVTVMRVIKGRIQGLLATVTFGGFDNSRSRT